MQSQGLKYLAPFAAGVLSVALHAAPAFAQQKAAAEALFRSGREAANRGDWVTACDRFSASNRLDPTPGTVLNLARCREELGQIASAWARYEEAAQKLPSSDRRRALALQKAEELEKRLPRVTLTFAAPPEGTTIEHNGSRLEPDVLGVPLPVDPGTQKIVVKAPRREPWTVEFEVREGESIEKELGLGPEVSEPERPEAASAEAPEPRTQHAPPAPDAQADSAKTWGYVAGGVGFVGASVGIVTGLFAMSEKEIVHDEANCKGRGCNSEGYEAAERGKVYSAASTIGFAVGLAGLGVGTYLLFFHEGDKRTQVAFRPTQDGVAIEIGGTL